MMLRDSGVCCYASVGTEPAYGATRDPLASYALLGTELAYGATRCPVLTWCWHSVWCYAMSWTGTVRTERMLLRGV
eukprot:3492377-Rhodomonas_salina.1